MTHNQETSSESLGLVFPVGQDAEIFISRLSGTEEAPEYVGNILRRTCVGVGESACANSCALRDFEPTAYVANDEKACADANLRDAFWGIGLRPSEVLMVAVTGDKVGFADKLDDYTQAGEVKQNPEGWKEIPGYNAFFAREGEAKGIGSRLADCAHISFEFQDKDGKTVFGFEHGTRPNMMGSSAYKFELDGKKVSYTEFVLASAIAHYDAKPESMKIRLSSSIQPQNFVKHFESEAQREGHIPGWFADGFAKNVSDPNWTEDGPYNKGDIWEADSRGLILRDITQAMEHLSIPKSALRADEMLDPADTDGEFSSYENRAKYGDSRDLYLVKVR